MAFFFQPLQAVFHREASESNGSATPGAVACHRFDTVPWETPQDGGTGLIAPLAGLNCVDLCSVWANPLGGDPIHLEAQSDDPNWLLGSNLFPNGRDALQDRVDVVALGFTTLQLKTPALRLDGAALAGFSVPPVTVGGYVLYTSQGGARRISNSIFGSYVDSSKDTLPSIEELLKSTEFQFIQGGARTFLGNTSGGQALFVNDCGAAYNDPCGCVFIDPGDIGNAAEQIPQDVASNSPAHYRFHPSVFFRRAQAVRAFAALDPTSGFPVNQNLGNLTVFSVSRAPTHSRWSFIFDGAEMDVVVTHPAGSDLRRPRDIWNSVIVDTLLRNNAGGNGLITSRVDDSSGPRLFIPDDLIKRMQYMQYARFIEPLDGLATPILVPVPQTVPA